MSDLPKDYDVIIAGTGLTESIVSAALSRIGKTVLHIDRESFYGGEFSSHPLTSLIEWTDKITHQSPKPTTTTTENQDNIFQCNNDPLMNYYANFKYEWNTKACPKDLKDKLLKLSRRFSLDLSPNIFYSRGKFIDLLISSDVSKYCEFRMVTQILTLNASSNELEKVPTSRSEVFKTDKLSMIEKRHMMKFIQACMKDNDFKELIEDGIGSVSFREFVRGKKLSDCIGNYIMNAVAMTPDNDQTVMEGLMEMKKFLSSVGRFGDSPFLYSLYGTGELPQCFCRMAAVFGAIYHLNMSIQSFETNKDSNLIETIKGKTNSDESEMMEFSCRNLIINSSYVPMRFFDSEKKVKKISRSILIIDRSFFAKTETDENISLLFLPKTSDKVPNIHCIEASSATQCCPKGYYVIYLFCDQFNTDNPELDFKEFIDLFFESKQQIPEKESELPNPEIIIPTRPNILFEYFYSHVDSESLIETALKSANIPANLFITTGSKAKLDFDDHVSQAKDIFEKICPGAEFLPKPPEQEDIIFDYEEEDVKEKEECVKEEEEGCDVVTLTDVVTEVLDRVEESVDRSDNLPVTSQESPTLKEPDGKKSKQGIAAIEDI